MFTLQANAQVPVDLSSFDPKSGAKATVSRHLLNVSWPAGEGRTGKLVFDLNSKGALFQSMQINTAGAVNEVARQLDPAFLLTTGKREIMGALTNQRSTTAVAAVIAAVIVGLNAFLLYQLFT